MKKNKLCIILLCVLLISLVGCNSGKIESENSRYENIAYNNLKTYTDITNIKLTKSSEEVEEMKYTYQVNNKDDQNIVKYKSYLTDEYGFTYNSEKSNDEIEYYDYMGSTIKFEIEKDSNNVFLVIHIPISDDYKEKNIEKKYEEAINYINNAEYRKARNILNSIRGTKNYSEYKEAGKALAYSNGMLYKVANNYGSAISSFKNAEDYMDAKEQINELESFVSTYEGTWYSDNPKYPGLGHGYYVFIKDGEVALEFEGMEKAYYIYSLAMKHNDENSLDEYFIANAIGGLIDDINYDDYEYLLYLLEDGSLILSGRSNTSVSAFTGVYDRISTDTPDSES